MKKQMPNYLNNCMKHSMKAPSHVSFIKKKNEKLAMHIFICRFFISDSNQIMAYTKSFEPLLKELANFMHSVPQQLQDISIKTVNSCMDKVGADITKDLKAIQANMLKTTRDNIKSEVRCKQYPQENTLNCPQFL